jgi:multiple sugar transport system permease protein
MGAASIPPAQAAADTAAAETRARAERRARARTRARRPKREGTPWWMWVAVVAIVLFCLFPFYWMVNISLKTGPDLSSADLLPPNPTLDNYTSIFKNSDFTMGLRNSAIVAITTTILALVVGSFAAYALARLKVRGKFWILAIVLSVSTFPGISIAAPLFKLWTDIGLYDTLPGLIIPNLTFALPLGIYTLVSFFRQIPKELEEAALVDGATRFQAFYKVVIPLAAPGMATAAILTFIAAWNEFLFAITLTSSRAARTVPASIAFFTGSTEFEEPLGTISAASVVISIPLIFMVLFFQKRIVAGLTAGAVKG